MRKMILVLIGLSFAGCHGLGRISGGTNTAPTTENLQAPQIPALQVPTILGYTPHEHTGWMLSDGQVLLEANRPYMATWVYEGGNWNRYPIPYTLGSRSIVYDSPTGMLKYSGFNTSTYYVLYQWLPG